MHAPRRALRAAAAATVAIALGDGSGVDATATTTPSCDVEVRDDLFSTFLPETRAGSQGFDVSPTADGGYQITADAPGVLANDESCGPVDISRTQAIGCASGPAAVSGSSDGSFSVTLPAGCDSASVSFEYDLQGDGGTIGTATATIVVDPVTYFELPDEAQPDLDEPTGGPDEGASLPATGRGESVLILLAAGCLLAGQALMAVTRTASRAVQAE